MNVHEVCTKNLHVLQYNFSQVPILLALMQICVSRSLVRVDSVKGVSYPVTFTLVLPGNSGYNLGTGNQATYKEGEKSVKHALLPAPCSTRLDNGHSIQWKCIC